MMMAGYRGRAFAASVALLTVAAVVVPAIATATPTVSFKTRAVPIPGVPGTGDMLGAGASIEGEGEVSGTEYGGAPPPVTEITFFGPAGAKLHPRGFATCEPGVLLADGPAACPKRSIAGRGSATGVVSFGGERVPETASLEGFFAPSGGMSMFIDGVTPALIEMVAKARVTTARPPFGLEFVGEVPLIETVPGALDVSALRATVELGAAYERGHRTISYVTLPKACPAGGWREKVQVVFLGGARAEASTRMPCPGR